MECSETPREKPQCQWLYQTCLDFSVVIVMFEIPIMTHELLCLCHRSSIFILKRGFIIIRQLICLIRLNILHLYFECLTRLSYIFTWFDVFFWDTILQLLLYDFLFLCRRSSNCDKSFLFFISYLLHLSHNLLECS